MSLFDKIAGPAQPEVKKMSISEIVERNKALSAADPEEDESSDFADGESAGKDSSEEDDGLEYADGDLSDDSEGDGSSIVRYSRKRETPEEREAREAKELEDAEKLAEHQKKKRRAMINAFCGIYLWYCAYSTFKTLHSEAGQPWTKTKIFALVFSIAFVIIGGFLLYISIKFAMEDRKNNKEQ